MNNYNNPTIANMGMSGGHERRQSLRIMKIQESLELNIPVQVLSAFEDLDSLDFNSFAIFELDTLGALSNIICFIFDKEGLFNEMDIPIAETSALMGRIQSSYLDNPYHNAIHAFDVTQVMHYFLKTCEFSSVGSLDPLEKIAMYLGAAIHDMEHP